MTTKQRRRAARHMKRLQTWINISVRKWRRFVTKEHGYPKLYNAYAVWRSISKHLRNRILRFKYENISEVDWK